MRHILTPFLAFHWAAAFALLATTCVMGGEGGAAAALELLGVSLSQSNRGGAAVTALLSLSFAVGSVLFVWAFLVAFLNDRTPDAGDDVIMRMAFGAAGCVMSLILIFGTIQGATGLFPAVAAYLAALMSSYLAVRAESRSTSMSGIPGNDDVRATARAMALAAAHCSMLARLSGRSAKTAGKA